MPVYLQGTCRDEPEWSETNKLAWGVVFHILFRLALFLCPCKAWVGSFNGYFFVRFRI